MCVVTAVIQYLHGLGSQESEKEVGDIGITIKFSKQKKWLHLKAGERTESVVVNSLLYADDMVVLDSQFESVKRFVLELDKQLCGVGMMMNVKKTKMMVLNGKMDEQIVIRGEKVEEEEKFPYLGVSIRTEQSSSCEEVALTISKAAPGIVSPVMEEEEGVGRDEGGDI